LCAKNRLSNRALVEESPGRLLSLITKLSYVSLKAIGGSNNWHDVVILPGKVKDFVFDNLREFRHREGLD